ncbi:hypothetical protein [Vibrio methylphosphonaticus]|uniref:hypothetical protein n=1 Tax=Vibrio methylphosphonaticus TaxID=2946866 RepID=UPI00202AAAB7|nr:hypothetical protein [Vibrio methylphosphonaticus]MCL9776769.1 hypothetical protein [Vibrio methylphosphonaticus]
MTNNNNPKKTTLSFTAVSLIASSLFVTNLSYADDNDRGEVYFRADVESQCGIKVEKDNGSLGFREYGDDAAQIKIINNNHDGQVRLKLTDIDFDDQDYFAPIHNQLFHFKVSGDVDKEGSASDWLVGQTFNHDELSGGQKLDIKAKIELDEADAIAKDDIVLETEWTAYCIS